MIVVTGGAGFIGSNLVAALDERGGQEIVVCDHPGRDEKWRNLAKHEVTDVVAPERLLDFLERNAGAADAVFHMGAISSTTVTDAELVMRNNFEFSLDLWRWCAANGVRMIYASSAATYGDGAQGFDDDGSSAALARLHPLNLYGTSKHLFDCRVARYVENGAPTPPQWAGLKFFNVYGPNEYHKGPMRSVVVQAWERAARGEPVRLFRSHHPDYEDGGQLRDFVSVNDCVAVMLWLYDNPDASGLFNMGTGTARSFADLANAVFAALGETPDVAYVDTPEDIRDKYQYFTQAEMAKLRAAGYEAPFLTLEDGVADYLRNHLSKADPYR
ncbi:MAG: ADP-glyceromanno-heptose 6-epimerase [Alphaproteobacteria bacterium]